MNSTVQSEINRRLGQTGNVLPRENHDWSEFQQFLAWKKANKSHARTSQRGPAFNSKTSQQVNSMRGQIKHLNETVTYLLGFITGQIQDTELSKLDNFQ